MVSPLTWLLLHAVLFIALGFVVIKSLRMLHWLDNKEPPIGARRVGFKLNIGDPFPVGNLREDIARMIKIRETLFLFAGPKCCICKAVVASLPHIAEDYKEIQFVILWKESWLPYRGSDAAEITILSNVALIRELGLTLQPFAIRTFEGRIREYGIVNSPEHLESVLNSRGPSWSAQPNMSEA